jgi:uncharacterized spore protein YtfJ
MKVDELLERAQDAITPSRVFSEPYERDGVTVITAATVGGGGGGGGGQDPEDGAEGEGAGFGMGGRPAGAYVIKDGEVTWMPAVDPNRVVTAVAVVAVVYFVTRCVAARRRDRRERKARKAATA